MILTSPQSVAAPQGSMKQRWAVILMIFCIAGVGTQAVGYLHGVDHRWQDAASGGRHDPGDHGNGEPAAPINHHDDCATCAALHAPLLPSAPPPSVAWLGMMLEISCAGPMVLTPQDHPRPAACRGPPMIPVG
jgi:hypothetical protein